MEVIERKRSRGGFLNLFDWHGKSRKKLFSSNTSELSGALTEESKQTIQNTQNLSSDSSCCASSVTTSDDGQGTRAPSVVARLMGLESLPLPNLQELRFNPDLDPFFLRPSRNENKWNAYENLGYVSLRRDYDGVSLDHLDSGTRPIERFQSETFPLRSVKQISVTNNRLLSPIRSPGFVPSRNPVYVMEAASRMIEPSPRIVPRTRFSSSDSSSNVPMRIQDLREKLEAAKKVANRKITNDTSNLKYTNGKQNEKRTSTPLTTSSTSSDGLKGKVKPPLSVNRSERQAEAKKRVVKSQNGIRGASVSTGKSVPKQNRRDNQPSVTKAVNKVPVGSGPMSKQSSLRTASAENNTSLSLSRRKQLSRIKKPPNGIVSNDKRMKRSENVIKCNITIDGGVNRGKDDGKKEMDVISFTFSSPIKGLSSDSLSSTQDIGSAVSFKMIGGDSLNVLLGQKLRELNSKLESSSYSLDQEKSSSEYEKSTYNGVDKVLSESESVSDCTSFYDKQKFKMIHEEEYEVSSISTVTESDELSSSCSKGFSNSRQTAECGYSSIAQEESELSESVITLTYSEAEERLDWELDYVLEILKSDQLMAKEFTLGMATDILPVSLFDEMEGRREATASKMERKALFDCVNSYLAFKCGFLGKGGDSFKHRNWLAEELNREIQELKKMRGMMMDKLVYKDMSSVAGGWLNFEKETYEEGIDIEEEILSTLVDDLINDLALVFKEKH